MADDKVAVILEDLRSQFKVFGEALGGLIERHNDHIEMTAKNSEDIEIIKSDIAFIKVELKKFIRVEEFESLEKRVVLLENKLARIG